MKSRRQAKKAAHKPNAAAIAAAAAAPLEIVYRDPKDLKADPRNARTHSKKQINLLVAAYKEFGMLVPILLKPDGTIGAGHGRHEAALVAKLEKVPTITKHGLSDAQWRAFMIADNKLAMAGSGWDEKILVTELTELRIGDFNMELIGFTKVELTGLGIPGFEATGGADAETNRIGGMQYAVIVRCKDEADQLKQLERFSKEGLKCEALIS